MAHQPHGRPIEILLVEDNPGDVRLTQEALKDGKITNHLHVVTDGQQALDFLFKRGEHTEAPRPDLILLDLNLPKVHGRDVLKEIKGNSALTTIPVVVLTMSGEANDVNQAYDLNANCYVRKPVELEQFIDVIASIDAFWMTVVALPPQSGDA